MISGRKTRPDRLTCGSAALLALSCSLFTLPASAFELTELMSVLAQRPSGAAKFSEQRFVSGLDRPLRSSGTISFKAPDRLARHTTAPRAESFVVEGNQVTLERGGRTRQVSLSTVPELGAMVAAIRGTLTGNAAALRQYFQPEVSGSAALWTLTLLPTDERLQGVVRQLRLSGRQADLASVEVQLADGDRSVMNIEALASGEPAAGVAVPPKASASAP